MAMIANQSKDEMTPPLHSAALCAYFKWIRLGRAASLLWQLVAFASGPKWMHNALVDEREQTIKSMAMQMNILGDTRSNSSAPSSAMWPKVAIALMLAPEADALNGVVKTKEPSGKGSKKAKAKAVTKTARLLTDTEHMMQVLGSLWDFG